MKIIKLLIISWILVLSGSHLLAQSEELAKINKFIEKEKVEKAKDYCFENTKQLTEEQRIECFIVTGIGYVTTNNGKHLKSLLNEIIDKENIKIAIALTNVIFEKHKYYSQSLFPILGSALIEKDMINEAAEYIDKIGDKEYTAKIAEKFAQKDKPYYNPQKAIELYLKLNSTTQLAELYFEINDYKKAIKYISPSNCIKYGDKLVVANKKMEAIPFFIKHLNQNTTINKFDFFNERSIINSLKIENNYTDFYNQLKENYIENLGPKFAPFPRTPESITAFAMLNNGKTIKETQDLLKELQIMDHAANLIIIQSLIKQNKISDVTSFIESFKGEKKLSYYVFSELMLDSSNETHKKYKASLTKKIGKPTTSFTSNYIGSAAVIYGLIPITKAEDSYMDFWKFNSLNNTYESLGRLIKEKDGEKYKTRLENILKAFQKDNNTYIEFGKSIYHKAPTDVLPLIYTLLSEINNSKDKHLAQLLYMRFYLSMSDYHILNTITYDSKVAQKAIINRKKWDEALNILDLGYTLSKRVSEITALGALKNDYIENISKHLIIITNTIEEAQAKGDLSFKNLNILSQAKNGIYFNYIESGIEFCEAQVSAMKKESEDLKSKGDELTENEQKHLKYLEELLKYVGPLPAKYNLEYKNVNSAYNRGLVSKSEPEIVNTALKIKTLIKDIARLNQLKSQLENPNPQFGKVKDIEGNEYKTVQIGNQTWMAENLKTSQYSNGEKIPFVGKPSTWAKLKSTAKARVQLKKSATKNIDVGALYTYAAATNGQDNINGQIQGVCPDGWHLPTDDEWKEIAILAYYVDSKNSSLILLDKRYGGFDTFGFSADLGGYANTLTGTISKENEVGFFWTSTSASNTEAYYRSVALLGGTGRFTERKETGFSVRCVKNNQ